MFVCVFVVFPTYAQELKFGINDSVFVDEQTLVISGKTSPGNELAIRLHGTDKTIKVFEQITVNDSGSFGYDFIWPKDSVDYPYGVYTLEIIDLSQNTVYESVEVQFTSKKWEQDVRNKFVEPPLKQFKEGVPLQEIKCKSYLQKMIKPDATPVCVNSSSMDKLIERGWTADHDLHHTMMNKTTESQSDAVSSKNEIEITNEEPEPFKYNKTSQIISETFLGKTVEQWQEISFDELMSEFEKYPNHEFFTDLGQLLIKNEMVNQMNEIGIVNANDDFAVMGGMHLDSLPPHIGWSAVVNATDGHSYRLQGGTHANQVSYHKTTQLEFYDTEQKISTESILTKPQVITILPENGNGARTEPLTMIIHAENSTIEFFNDSPYTIRIQEDGTGKIGEEHLLDWVGPIIPPYQRTNMTFDKPGHYEWDGRKAPSGEYPDWWETHASGIIVVIGDNMGNLSQFEKAQMAQAIVMDSEIPVFMVGIGANDVLQIGIDRSVAQSIPDAKQYYESRIQQLLPFEVEFNID